MYSETSSCTDSLHLASTNVSFILCTFFHFWIKFFPIAKRFHNPRSLFRVCLCPFSTMFAENTLKVFITFKLLEFTLPFLEVVRFLAADSSNSELSLLVMSLKQNKINYEDLYSFRSHTKTKRYPQCQSAREIHAVAVY